MKLLSVARALFAEQGFADTPLDLVVERAGVTKGALYHHFKNKRDLFQAVFEQLEQEMCEKVITAAIEAGEENAIASMQAGVRAFMESALDPAAQRIVLIEGPTVLGWDTWREIDERYGYALVKGSIDNAMEQGELERRPSEPLSHLFLAAISEAALQVARADDKEAALEEMTAAVMSILDGMRMR
jgi:AcrR family transcriptional regulator